MRVIHRASILLAAGAFALSGCSQPEPETVYQDVPAPEPSELSPPDDRTDPEAVAQFFVATSGDIDPASQTGTTRINQMKNELIVHPAAEGCSEGIFDDREMETLRDDGIAVSIEGDIQDVTDDPVDEDTQFAHSYQFTLQAVDGGGNVSPDHLNGGERTMMAYIIAERNSDSEPFMITQCSFQNAAEEVSE